MNKKPKVFIYGISGFLGYQLAIHLRKKFLVSGACFQNFVSIPHVQTFPVSLKNLDLLEPLARIQSPDFIINTMGITSSVVANENINFSDNINTMLAVSVAVLSAKMRTKYIHLSCADVYDGADGNYKETDNDFTIFHTIGKQKIAAESYIRAQTLESTILRVGKVIGLGGPQRENFFEQIRTPLLNKNVLTVSKDHIHSFLSIQSLCAAIELILEGEIPNKHRIFNLGGFNMSEFDFAYEWIKLTGAKEDLLKEPQEVLKRNLSMNCQNIQRQYPAWKIDSKSSIYTSLIEALCPAVGTKKWQKTLQTL